MKDNDCRTKPRARTTGTPGDRTGPSLDTLDSFVVPVVCQNCMVVCEDNGYCPVCCQYETLDGHNAAPHTGAVAPSVQALVGNSGGRNETE